MMVSGTLLWLLSALVLGGIELLIGTFYLLVLAAGALAGALASWLGAPVALQCSLCAVVMLAGGLYVRRLRLHKNESQSASLQNLDVGQTVSVDHWNPDGTATVRYRGAFWTAQLQEGSLREAQHYVIEEVDGSRLLIRAQ